MTITKLLVRNTSHIILLCEMHIIYVHVCITCEHCVTDGNEIEYCSLKLNIFK